MRELKNNIVGTKRGARMFGIFKKKHICDFNKIVQRSNAIQFDEMGYPLRLCILKCECGATTQMWVDTGKRYETEKGDVEVLWDKEDKE